MLTVALVVSVVALGISVIALILTIRDRQD